MPYSNPTALPARTLTTTLDFYIQQDCMVDAISFSNTTGSDATVKITDGNGKVFELLLNIPAGTRQQLPLSQSGNPLQQGVFFAGGLKVQGGTATAIDMWISARTFSAI